MRLKTIENNLKSNEILFSEIKTETESSWLTMEGTVQIAKMSELVATGLIKMVKYHHELSLVLVGERNKEENKTIVILIKGFFFVRRRNKQVLIVIIN